MLCNEIFDFLCAPGNGADILDISINEIRGMGTIRLEKVSEEIKDEIEIGKYEICYKWQEGNLVQVSLYHPKYCILYSKSVVPGTQRRMSLSF